jgi:hypothetical protein
MNNMTKKIYTAPELTIVTVAVERGFAQSNLSQTTFDIMRGQAFELLIDFNPIQGYEVVDNAENPFPNQGATNTPSNNFWKF